MAKVLVIAPSKIIFLVKEFSVPNYYLDKKLTLDFKADSKFTLSHKDKVIFEGRLNQLNQFVDGYGAWKINISSTQPFEHAFILSKLSLPSAVKNLKLNYGVAEKENDRCHWFKLCWRR